MSTSATFLFGFVATLALIGATLATASRRAARQEAADDLEAARLRLLDEGIDVHDLRPVSPAPYMPPVPSVPSVPSVPFWDDRTAALAVDPTLRPAEVAEMVEHVAPGAGSVASLAHTGEDTRIRSAGQLRDLRHAEVAAYAEAAERDDREFFARFDRIMSVALATFRENTVRVDNWLFYGHDDALAECPHCTAALHEVSDEYRQIVGAEDTGVFSRADLDELLAVRA